MSLRSRINKINVKNMSTKNVNELLNSTALRESGFQYIWVAIVLVASLYEQLGFWGTFALLASVAGILIGGYIKKIAENKMADIIKANKEKDEEIISLKSQITDLKAIKQKLMEEIKEEVIKSFPSTEKTENI